MKIQKVNYCKHSLLFDLNTDCGPRKKALECKQCKKKLTFIQVFKTINKKTK